MARTHIKNQLHTSSLYTLKLAGFLQKKSLSRNEIQTLFSNDEDCQELLSADTIRLYADALHAVGCILERPCSENKFTYTLHHLPLGFRLDAQEWEQFCCLLHDVLNRASVTEFIRYYQFTQQLAQSVVLEPERRKELNQCLQHYLSPQQFDQVCMLQQAVSRYTWFELEYDGQTKHQHWQAIHEATVMYDARLYWLCYRYHPELNTFTPMMLRLNRCRQVVLHKHMATGNNQQLPLLQQAFKAYLAKAPNLCIDVVLPQGINFTSPNLPFEQYALLEPSQATRLPEPLLHEIEAFYGTPTYTTRYTVRTPQAFYLKHSLRTLGGFLVPVNAAALALLSSFPFESELV